jgi:hypothetical protein
MSVLTMILRKRWNRLGVHSLKSEEAIWSFSDISSKVYKDGHDGRNGRDGRGIADFRYQISYLRYKKKDCTLKCELRAVEIASLRSQ